MTLTPETIPSKFYPFLLGNPSCNSQGKEEIDALFSAPLTQLKGNVFTAGRWVLKVDKTGPNVTVDTNIYRIREAEKIRRYIAEHHLENQMMVPKKFLYWQAGEKRFYVICEKVDLSEEVAQFTSPGYEQVFEKNGEVLAPNTPQRTLTPEQAKALADLSRSGYTNLNHNKVFFTKTGQIALIDTEPLTRALKKQALQSKLSFFVLDRCAMVTQKALVAFAKLKGYCSDSAALKAVQSVEKRLALLTLAKLVGKIALTCLAIYFTFTFMPLLPIGALAVSILKFVTITPLSIKACILLLQTVSLASNWALGNLGEKGLNNLLDMENKGTL